MYRLSDGGSLYLEVLPSGGKSWKCRFKRGGTIRAYVIGAHPEVSIAAARVERDRLEHRMRTTGIDRLAAEGQAVADAKLENERKREETARFRAEREHQRAEERAAKFAAAETSGRRTLTVEDLLRLWSQHKETVWAAHGREQILPHVEDYVVTVIGEKAVADLELADDLTVVDPPIADGKIETARRVRQRLSEMLDHAAAHRKINNNIVRLAAHELRHRFERGGPGHPQASHPTLPIVELPQLLQSMGTYVGTPVTRSPIG